MNDYDSDKSDLGEMDGGAETSPPFWQTGADGSCYAKLYITRELGLNPNKLGKIDNHKQEPWKRRFRSL